jgi:hypothetical protein
VGQVTPKRCTRCGLIKAPYCYHLANGGASLNSRCKDCHRSIARESARRRYAVRAERDKARKRERYWSEVGYRERKIAGSVVYKRRMREAAEER